MSQLNGKTVAKIYQVDFNSDRNNDHYLPWLIYIIFSDYNKFLEIEGDFDGDHIKINLYDLSELDQKLKENDFPGEINLWKVYEVERTEILRKLLDQKISKCAYGIEKDGFSIDSKTINGQIEEFTYLKIFFNNSSLSIYEWGGLLVSDNPLIKIPLEEISDRFETA